MSGRQAKRLRKELRRHAAAAGPLRLRVQSLADGQVAIEFGRLTAGFRVSAEEARRFGEALLRHAGGGQG